MSRFVQKLTKEDRIRDPFLFKRQRRDFCTSAAELGSRSQLSWAHSMLRIPLRYEWFTQAAATHGDITTFRWLSETHSCTWSYHSAVIAADCGHYEFLEWYLSSGKPYE